MLRAALHVLWTGTARAGEINCEHLLEYAQGKDAGEAIPELTESVRTHDYFTTPATVDCLEKHDAPDWLIWWAKENEIEPENVSFSGSLGSGFQTGLAGITLGIRWNTPRPGSTAWHGHAYVGIGWSPFEPTSGFLSGGLGLMSGIGHRHRLVLGSQIGIVGRYEDPETGGYPVAPGLVGGVGYEFYQGPAQFHFRVLTAAGWTWAQTETLPTFFPTYQLALGF